MACETCGSTQVFRKSNVALEARYGSGAMLMNTAGNRYLRFTFDVCGGCGRTNLFLQDHQDWLQKVGYDAVFDTSTPA